MEPNIAVEGRDFSIIGLIMHADPFVQAIMLVLAICSVLCWALIFEKAIRLTILKRQVRQLASQAAAGRLSSDRGRGIVGAVQAAAQGEWADGVARGESRNELRARIERSMRSALKTRDAAHRDRPAVPRHRRLRLALRRAARHRVGHHEQLHRHRPGEGYEPRRRRSRHRRGTVRDGARSRRRHSRPWSPTIRSPCRSAARERRPAPASRRWRAPSLAGRAKVRFASKELARWAWQRHRPAVASTTTRWRTTSLSPRSTSRRSST